MSLECLEWEITLEAWDTEVEADAAANYYADQKHKQRVFLPFEEDGQWIVAVWRPPRKVVQPSRGNKKL